MRATRIRPHEATCQDLWPVSGPQAECATCYQKALEYTARRVGAFGVTGLWAEDVAVEALRRTVKAFNPDYRSQSSAPFRSFLVSVARTRAQSHLRSEARRRRRGEIWEVGKVRLVAADQLDDLIADLDLVRHVIEEAHRTWGARDPDIAQVCEMWLLGQSHQTIAAEMGINERTVRRHRTTINDWLRRKFAS